MSYNCGWGKLPVEYLRSNKASLLCHLNVIEIHMTDTEPR